MAPTKKFDPVERVLTCTPTTSGEWLIVTTPSRKWGLSSEALKVDARVRINGNRASAA
jgi:hypothetical protein